MTVLEPYEIRRPLTTEIASSRSPVRQFLDERFASGLRDVQRRYREAGPPIVIPSVPREAANPGTIGTAADWLLRFMLRPEPELHLVMCGVAIARTAGISTLAAVSEIAQQLGIPRTLIAGDIKTVAGNEPEHGDRRRFTGPAAGCGADPEVLDRACWALALLTEAYRGGPMAAIQGPLGRLRGGGKVSADALLGLAPQAGLDQLARFREVFETILIPKLATWRGAWVLGPTFTGSELVRADADLIAAGLLLEMKTSGKALSLPATDLLQVLGYALLDFDDEFRLSSAGTFSARYGYLATWELDRLLGDLAGHTVSLRATREEFRALLLAHQPRRG